MRGPSRVNERCAEIVRGFVELNDQERLVRFMAPIRVAEAGITAEALSSDLYSAIEYAWALYLEALYAYRRERTRVRAQATIRNIDALQADLQRLRLSIKTREELGS